MKKTNQENGITMVALVVTIVILILLAGISFQVTIGENGIITKAKQAKQNIILAGEAEALQLNQLYYELETGGEMSEDEESAKKDEMIALLQKQVEELQKQVASLQTENAELKKQIEDFNIQISNLQKEIADLKAQIASKDMEIANLKKQISEKEAKIQDLQNQLNNLNALLTQTNATDDKILAGYKAYSGGKLLTGTMTNRGAISSSLNCGQSYTIPVGYHNGAGKVTANSLASQTQATASVSDILQGKTAWVNGVCLTGTATDKSKQIIIPSIYGASVEDSSHYYAGGGGIEFKNVKQVTIANLTISGKGNWPSASSFYLKGKKDNQTTTIASYSNTTNINNLRWDVSTYESIEIYAYSYNGTQVKATNIMIDFK